MIVLTGGTVYGVPNTNTTVAQHVCEPREVDVVIAAGRILALMKPSETPAFVNYTRKHNFQVLSVPIEGQLVIPGLIDPHVHAIGGGGEQGMSILRCRSLNQPFIYSNILNTIFLDRRSLFSNCRKSFIRTN